MGNIPYPILSDFHPKGEVSRAYGVYNDQRGTPDRAVVIIDKEGTVRFKSVYGNVTDLKTDDILAEVRKL